MSILLILQPLLRLWWGLNRVGCYAQHCVLIECGAHVSEWEREAEMAVKKQVMPTHMYMTTVTPKQHNTAPKVVIFEEK